MNLPKLGIINTYLFKHKWLEKEYKEGSFKRGLSPKGYFDVRRLRGS